MEAAHERPPVTTTVINRILADRLAAEIKQLFYGKTVVECIQLLQAINHAMKIDQAEATDAEPVRVH